MGLSVTPGSTGEKGVVDAGFLDAPEVPLAGVALKGVMGACVGAIKPLAASFNAEMGRGAEKPSFP